MSKQPLEFFKELTRIPRETGDEKAVSDYILEFARRRGLEAVQDEVYNVIVYKPGTPGYEQAPAVVLQGHLDMVYIKGESSPHDYNSPLELIEEADMLRANDTSLGADNGIGCAYALALLDSTDLPHPPLEALFTTGEEVGMVGVETLDPARIHGRRLINLDSEGDNGFTVGCAGGVRISVRLDAGWTDPPAGYAAWVLNIHELRGGHSGLEIDKGRGNANRLLGRTLLAVSRKTALRVGALSGGSKTNAIPDRAEAVLLVPEKDAASLQAAVAGCQEDFRAELGASDPDVTLSLSPAQAGQGLSEKAAQGVITLLCAIPTGVQSMSMYLPGLVECSNNIGTLVCEDGAVHIHCAVRSSVSSLKHAVCDQIELIATAAGASTERASAYPAWPYAPQSPLRDLCTAVYREIYGREPEVGAIHAGLECGYFIEMWPDMDVISMGPNISGAHTPQETLDLASCRRMWQLLLRLLAAMK